METFRANLGDRDDLGMPTVVHALEYDLKRFKPDQLVALIGTDRVDGSFHEAHYSTRLIESA